MALVAIFVPWRQAATAPFCFPSSPPPHSMDPSNGHFWSALIGSLLVSRQTLTPPESNLSDGVAP